MGLGGQAQVLRLLDVFVDGLRLPRRDAEDPSRS
jgi:hypothetical protein